MKEYKISVNQLADFTKGTEAKKKSIIKQQKNPNPIIVARYATAKAGIRKTIAVRGDINPILQGIEKLKNKKQKLIGRLMIKKFHWKQWKDLSNYNYLNYCKI